MGFERTVGIFDAHLQHAPVTVAVTSNQTVKLVGARKRRVVERI